MCHTTPTPEMMEQLPADVLVQPGRYFIGDISYAVTASVFRDAHLLSAGFRTIQTASSRLEGIPLLGYRIAEPFKAHPEHLGAYQRVTCRLPKGRLIYVVSGILGMVPEAAWAQTEDVLTLRGLIVDFERPERCMYRAARQPYAIFGSYCIIINPPASMLESDAAAAADGLGPDQDAEVRQ